VAVAPNVAPGGRGAAGPEDAAADARCGPAHAIGVEGASELALESREVMPPPASFDALREAQSCTALGEGEWTWGQPLVIDGDGGDGRCVWAVRLTPDGRVELRHSSGGGGGSPPWSAVWALGLGETHARAQLTTLLN
jgi:hypothetical protein